MRARWWFHRHYGGGIISDYLAPRVKGAYLWVCSGSCLLTVIPMMIAISSRNPYVYITATFIAITLIFLGNGPVNAVIVNLIPPSIRTTAIGFVVVIIHVFGDGISVTLVGWISTKLKHMQHAMPDTVTSIGNLFHLVPHQQTLSMGLLIMPVAVFIGAILYYLALKTKEGSQT